MSSLTRVPSVLRASSIFGYSAKDVECGGCVVIKSVAAFSTVSHRRNSLELYGGESQQAEQQHDENDADDDLQHGEHNRGAGFS
jgi:hypothetical protein